LLVALFVAFVAIVSPDGNGRRGGTSGWWLEGLRARAREKGFTGTGTTHLFLLLF